MSAHVVIYTRAYRTGCVGSARVEACGAAGRSPFLGRRVSTGSFRELSGTRTTTLSIQVEILGLIKVLYRLITSLFVSIVRGTTSRSRRKSSPGRRRNHRIQSHSYLNHSSVPTNVTHFVIAVDAACARRFWENVAARFQASLFAPGTSQC